MDRGANGRGEKLSRVIMYVDGVKTGEIPNVRNTRGNGLFGVEFDSNGDYAGRTQYLRNLVLGGFTPHGMFYDRQYYSDAALAYDDVAIYTKALTQEQIQAIINNKQYTPKEWHYGDSFDEYNEGRGGHEQKNDITGLGLWNPPFDKYGYLGVDGDKNKTLTIPNVPNGYYVRIEYQGSDDATTTTNDRNFPYVGWRAEDNPPARRQDKEHRFPLKPVDMENHVGMEPALQ